MVFYYETQTFCVGFVINFYHFFSVQTSQRIRCKWLNSKLWNIGFLLENFCFIFTWFQWLSPQTSCDELDRNICQVESTLEKVCFNFWKNASVTGNGCHKRVTLGQLFLYIRHFKNICNQCIITGYIRIYKSLTIVCQVRRKLTFPPRFNITSPFCTVTTRKMWPTNTKIRTKNCKNWDLIQLHLKVQKIYRNKKVTKNVDYYNEKGFKVLLSCAKKNCSRLIFNIHLHWYAALS